MNLFHYYFTIVDSFPAITNWNLYISISYLIFLIGISGMVFNYKNFLVTMLCIELMYLGIISGFILIASCYNITSAQVYALFILILAASESAVGLGMLIVLFRYGKSIEFSSYQQLRG